MRPLKFGWTKAETALGTYTRASGSKLIYTPEVPMGSFIRGGVDRFVPRDARESDGVAIVSGGMDSITLVYYLRAVHGATPHLLSFDYGQRHKKELDFA